MTIKYLDSKRLSGISTGHTTAGTPYDASDSNLAYAEGHDFSSHSTNSIGMASSPDGTHFYISEEGGGIHQFDLSTAWDVSTAVWQREYTHGLTNPKGIFFKSDGTYMYLASFNAATVYRYPLNTAWDLSTVQSTDQSLGTASNQDLFISSDGTKLFVSDNSGNVKKWNLGTAWTINSNTSTDGTYSGAGIGIGAVTFSADGTKMFLGGWNSSGYIKQYALSTAWQISSGVSFTQNYTESGSQTSDIQGMNLSATGNKFFVLDQTNDYIRQYNAVDTLDSDRNGVTNVQDSSIYIETDTAERYWYNGTSWFPTFQDDFSTDKGWTNLTSNTSITTKLNYSEVSSTYIRATKDLQDSNALGSGNNMSDNFVIRFELNKTNNATDTSNGTEPLIGISSATSDAWFNNQDSIGMLLRQDTNQTHCIRAVGADNQYTHQGDSADAAYTWTTGIRYCEIIKNATADTVTATLYSDSNYSNSLVTATFSTSGKTFSGLRYLSMRNFADSGRSSTVWEMNNIQVYDGVTSA